METIFRVVLAVLALLTAALYLSTGETLDLAAAALLLPFLLLNLSRNLLYR